MDRDMAAILLYHVHKSTQKGGDSEVPLYSIDIQKRYGDEYWTNRYIVDELNSIVAADKGLTIATIERDVHGSQVVFDKLRASSVASGDSDYTILPLGVNGNIGDSDPIIPLWNVARADFAVGGGRPSRKYYRPGVSRQFVVGGLWTATYYAALQTSVASLAALPGLVDVDGQLWTAAVAFQQIGMRQLRRGSRRRRTPILP